MLLAEKSTNRIVRQSQEEVSSALRLPVALLQHVSPSIRVSALVEFLKESQRLANSAADPRTHIPALLDHIAYVDALSSRIISAQRVR
jgi:U3 small nucleolar RNA-associated protein 10